MRRPTSVLRRAYGSRSIISTRLLRPQPHRHLLTLAIETSCDDTAVAILEKKDAITPSPSGSAAAILHFNSKVTADNAVYRGVHPIVSLESHQANLGPLLNEALQHLPAADPQGGSKHEEAIAVKDTNGIPSWKKRPNFISVTRGPGMRSSLSTGLDTAKGLAIAWQIPLIGVHHMQAHALTPRLVSALEPLPAAEGGSSSPQRQHPDPPFPFLSLLVSGGHTLLLHTHSLTSHALLATTADIALGDALDKIARLVLPPQLLAPAKDTMYGALLERFAFPPSSNSIRTADNTTTTGTASADAYDYTPPTTLNQALLRRPTKWGWSLAPPLAETKGGTRRASMEFSFCGLLSSVERVMRYGWDHEAGQISKTVRAGGEQGVSEDERRDLAREAMRVAFEHLGARVVMALCGMQAQPQSQAQTVSEDAHEPSPSSGPETVTEPTALVLSGGVASNACLRHILRSMLASYGFGSMRLLCPPPSLCTDNAAMIAWAGMEMFEAGWRSGLDVRAVRRWGMDPGAEDGGIEGVGGWIRREGV